MLETRILLVDDHGLFRESLGRVLNTALDMTVVGECATVAEAFDALSRSDPDVILLDYDLGEESGLGLLSEFKRSASTANVLMVTAGLHDEVVLRVMELGASGIFLNHGSPDRLIHAI